MCNSSLGSSTDSLAHKKSPMPGSSRRVCWRGLAWAPVGNARRRSNLPALGRAKVCCPRRLKPPFPIPRLGPASSPGPPAIGPGAPVSQRSAFPEASPLRGHPRPDPANGRHGQPQRSRNLPPLRRGVNRMGMPTRKRRDRAAVLQIHDQATLCHEDYEGFSRASEGPSQIRMIGRGHFFGAFCSFGRLAPYLDRPWRRFSTPAESKVPRRMW